MASLDDPSGLQIRRQPIAEVAGRYRGWGRWIESHLLDPRISLAPSEGAPVHGIAVASRSVTLGSVRIPMYLAEPEDVVEGRTTENARLAAFEVFPDVGSDHVVEEPLEGGPGGMLFGPLADAILESVPSYERRFGAQVRLLQLPGLFVTAIWLPAPERGEERLVPIHTLSSEVELGHAYAPDDFEHVLRLPALEHVREATLEREQELDWGGGLEPHAGGEPDPGL